MNVVCSMQQESDILLHIEDPNKVRYECMAGFGKLDSNIAIVVGVVIRK